MGKGGLSGVFSTRGGGGGAPPRPPPPFSLFSPVPRCMMLLQKKKIGNGDQDSEVQGRGGGSSCFLQFSILVTWCSGCTKEDLEKIKNVDKKVTSSSYRKLIGFAGISKREIF